MISFLQRHVLAASAVAALLAGAGGTVARQLAAAEPVQISIENFRFSPGTLTIDAGTTVTWVNNDEEPHSVLNVGQPVRVFRSPGLDDGEKFSFVFDKPGTYDYICSIHPQMSGKIIVQ